MILVSSSEKMLEVIKMWFPLESAGRSFGCKRTSLIEAARRRFLENHRGCGIVGKRDFPGNGSDAVF